MASSRSLQLLRRGGAREEIGECPACHNPVVVGKGNFHCSNRECKFVLWEDNRYLASMKARLDKRLAQALLKDGRVHMKGLYSQRTGKSFDADLVLSAEEDGCAKFSMEFSKRKKQKSERKNGGAK